MGNPSQKTSRRMAGGACSADYSNITVRTRPSRLVKAPPQPDPAGTNITGRWDDVHEQGQVLHVNRAGSYLALWLVARDGRVVRLSGERDLSNGVEEVYKIFDAGGDNELGSLLVQSEERFVSTDPGWRARSEFSKRVQSAYFLSLDYNGRVVEFFRANDAAAFSESVLAAFPQEVRSTIREHRVTPVPLVYLDRVVRALGPAVVSSSIARFHQLQDGWTPNAVVSVQQEVVLRELNRSLGAVFAGVPDVHLVRLATFARLHLQQNVHVQGGRRQSLLGWLTEMVASVRSGASADVDGHLQAYLGLRRSGGKVFYYSLALRLGALTNELQTLGKALAKGAKFKIGLGGGYLAGTLDVQRVEPVAPGVEEYAAVGPLMTFRVHFMCFGGGLGVNVAIVTSTPKKRPVPVPVEWEAHHFAGAARMVDAGLMFGTFGYGATGLVLTGNGANPEMVVDLSGSFMGLGVSAGLSEYVGDVLPPVGAQEPSWTPPSRKSASIRVQHRANTRVHFALGSSLLTDVGRYGLRVLAAEELVLFRQGNESELIVDAHADRVDSEEYNCVLTRLRADNVVQTLRDVLGEEFKVSRVVARGLGEQEASKTDKDGQANQFYRRADLSINGRLVLVLEGQ